MRPASAALCSLETWWMGMNCPHPGLKCGNSCGLSWLFQHFRQIFQIFRQFKAVQGGPKSGPDMVGERYWDGVQATSGSLRRQRLGKISPSVGRLSTTWAKLRNSAGATHPISSNMPWWFTTKNPGWRSVSCCFYRFLATQKSRNQVRSHFQEPHEHVYRAKELCHTLFWLQIGQTMSWDGNDYVGWFLSRYSYSNSVCPAW